MRKSALKNIISNMSYYLTKTILGFVIRKLFVVYWTDELLGLNGLLTSIISMLSIVELGFSGAIGYSLYKPLKENDEKLINSIMAVFSKVYRYMGIAVLVIGLALLPFLHFFVETDISFTYVYKVYLVFLIDSVLSYFLSYRRVIIQSDQKSYVIQNIDTAIYLLTSILQVMVMVVFKSYMAFLFVKLGLVVVGNIIIFYKSKKLYPYVHSKKAGNLPAEVKSTLIYNVKALFVIKISSFFVLGTDNILLTKFVDLKAVAIYSNYLMIIGVVNNVVNGIFGNITANLGNYLVSNTKEDIAKLYKNMLFINFAVTSYSSIALLTLLNEFIGNVWMGKDFVWPVSLVIILVFNNYSRYITMSSESFRTAAGLYSPKPFVKYLALAEGLINLIVSVLFAYVLNMGAYGVFLGTATSTLVATISVPWIIYKFLLDRKLSDYFKVYFKYLASTVVLATISYLLMQLCSTSISILNVIIGLVISFVVPAIGIYLLFRKTSEYLYLVGVMKGYLGNVRKKTNGE